MIAIHENIALRPYNSFGVDAKARRLIEFETPEDLHRIFSGLLQKDEPWYVIGGGNNILFTRDYPGTLLHPVSRQITVLSENDQLATVRVDAGTEWDDLVAWSVERNLWGLENLSAIPGYVGAAPVQNIGAYGAEAKDAILRVEMFCTDTLNTLTLEKQHCAFGYRESVFKHSLRGKVIITSVVFGLSKVARPMLGYGDLEKETEALGGPTAANIRRAVTAIRNRKLPDPGVTGNAGSFFKNPLVDAGTAESLRRLYPDMPSYPAPDGKVKLACGWLIERCGWKGRNCGPVGVHPQQALVLVNLGGATGQDVLDLADTIRNDVQEKFGVVIETEVNIC